MTSLPLVMAGFDRRYQPPRAIRRAVSGDVTAWDLFELESDPVAGQWATDTLTALLASVVSVGEDVLGCTECEDTGFYGVPAEDDPDMLVSLLRRVGFEKHEALTADGQWEPWDGDCMFEVLSLDEAADLAAALTAGACGLVRRDAWPLAFFPPSAVVAAAPLADVLMSVVDAQPPENPRGKWVNYALVDGIDQGAILDVVRLRASAGTGELQRWDGAMWMADGQLLMHGDAPLVELPHDMTPESILSSGFPKNQKCHYCDLAATKRIIHSEGMAYIPTCDQDHAHGLDDAAHCTPDGTEDLTNIVRVDPIAASLGPLVADAPLTVSPDPRAARLRRYWSTGRGGAKIRWHLGGDWRRCYRQLRKYMGLRAKGYCANLHKKNTGMWPGDRKNRGLISGASPEAALLASIQTGQWGRTKGRNTDMPLTEQMLTDGEYAEIDREFEGITATITAGGFPVAPKDEWFENPRLSGPTPLVVKDDGQVYGHIAQFGTFHIGMAGKVPVPHSPSNYAYFATGALTASSGKQYNVGQLTLAGGHAPLKDDQDRPVNAAAAVKHYDDTNSAVADVTAGEDRYGIWVAGALRPDVTPEQVRAFRASGISGDWRIINGNRELVAACAVNVPGFPVVRALVAGGAVVALVAAGARPLEERRAAMTADAALLERVLALEARLDGAEVPVVVEIAGEPVDADASIPAEVGKEENAQVVEAEPVAAAADVVDAPTDVVAEPAVVADEPAELTEQDLARAEAIRRARADIAALKRDALRAQVHNGVTAAAASTIQGTDSFPISDVASLKKAIQAFGRAKDKEKAKKHIQSMAFKLKRPDLIPANWK